MDLAINMLANQNLIPLIALLGEISSSDEEEEMIDVESNESHECAQREILPVEIIVQPYGKRARGDGVGTESEEKGPLEINLSGASSDEVTNSPAPRRRQKHENVQYEREKITMASFVSFFLIMTVSIGSLNVRGIKSGWRNAAVIDYLGTQCGSDGPTGVNDWQKGAAVWAPCCRVRAEGV